MPRPRRHFQPFHCYHVVQRGNKGQWVYGDQQDYQFALTLLFEKAAQYRVLVHEVCLTPSQGQWLLEPRDATGISCLMRDMQSRLSKYLNRKYRTRPWRLFVAPQTSDREGGLGWRREAIPLKTGVNWTPRFYAAELERREFDSAVAYLRQGPRRAGLRADRRDYRIPGANPRKPIAVTLGRMPDGAAAAAPADPGGVVTGGRTEREIWEALDRASRSRVPFARVLARIRMKRAHLEHVNRNGTMNFQRALGPGWPGTLWGPPRPPSPNPLHPG